MSMTRPLHFCGDPHAEWSKIFTQLSQAPVGDVVLVGDLELEKPFPEAVKRITDLGHRVWWIMGNHDIACGAGKFDLWRDGEPWGLDRRVTPLGGLRILGMGGIFKSKVWWPREDPLAPALITRRDARGTATQYRTWSPIHTDTVTREDFEQAARQFRCDILVTHEAPSVHKFGFAAIDWLAKATGARLIVHGHHHYSYEDRLPSGIRVRGMGLAEVWSLPEGYI